MHTQLTIYRQVCMCKSTLSKSRFDEFDDHCMQLTVKARCAIIVVLVYEGRRCGHCLTLVLPKFSPDWVH